MRATASIVAGFFCVSCLTEQLASLPETADTHVAVSHCLASLGFWEDRDLLAEFDRPDHPGLAAVWRTHSRAYGNAPGTTVWVTQSQGQLHLRFLPGAGEDDSGTEVLARAFRACIPQHAADVSVKLTTQTSPDLR